MADKDFHFTESNQIDVKNIFLKYFRHWYLNFFIVLMCLGGAYLYIKYSTPEYYVSSTLLIKDSKMLGNAPLSSDFGGGELTSYRQSLDNEIEVLKSKELMQRVLKELSLEIGYFVEGQFTEKEIYGEQLPIKVILNELAPSALGKSITLHIIDNNNFDLINEQNSTSDKFGQKVDLPFGTFTIIATPDLFPNSPEDIIIKFNDVRKLANYYNSKLGVTPVNKEASVVLLDLTDPVPEKGVDIINKLIELYNTEAVNEKKAVAANSLKFLDGRIDYLNSELTEVEGNVESYKKKKEVTDVDSDARLYLEKSTDYNRQLSEANVQIDVLETIESYLSKNENKYELVPSTLNIQDPTLIGLIRQFNELQLERQNYLRTMQPNHPLVRNINEQLTNLQSNILENLQNIKKGQIISRDNLQRSYAQFESKKQQVPSIQRELLEINRQQSTKEGLYLYLLQKREESALSLEANVNNAKVLDSAMASSQPVKPRKQLIFLMALLIGIGLPFATIYIKDILNDKVQQKNDVEKITATPILGEISHNSSRDLVVVTNKNRSPVAELFRLIRANLQFAAIGSDNKVILVTSSMSGEGKSFFSINLGASIALTGKKVVVLEFDLRKPGITNRIISTNHKYSRGITDYLISDHPLINEFLTPIQDLPELYLISSGSIPPNPSEIMLHPKVGSLIQELEEIFDFIIIDTSPIGQVADALALAPYIDSSIFIIRYDYTSKEQVKIIDDIYLNRKLRHPMIVLNDAKKENGYGFGYGYGYGEESGSDWGSKFIKRLSV